jgi:mono/diheme cytochrome c family protein
MVRPVRFLCFAMAALAVTFSTRTTQTASAQGAADPRPAARTVWDGVYNLTQAARGETAYNLHCASCHRDDLSGYDGLLRGQRFMDKYREASVDLLFQKTKTTMPRNAAGTLSDQTYVDIVSYVLKVNEFPPGAGELHVDDLAVVRLVGKGGPEPVPDFSLVQVIGCLANRDDAWLLTSATEPVRTALPQPAAEDLAALKASSGSGTFRLLVSAAYSPADHAGRVVEVRGFLIRRPSESRINVTSIQAIGPACPP